MRLRVSKHGCDGDGRWAKGLASPMFTMCLVALLSTTAYSQSPGTDFQDRGINEAQNDTRSQGSSIFRLAPSELIRSLTGGNNSQSGLPTPPPSEMLPPKPADQQMIPITGPEELGEAVVEHDQGRISLMVRDASLRQVVALIAETQNLNLVFATNADTPVTASFDKVPWEQVLDSLLSASGHTWTTNNGVIMITNMANADLLSPNAGGRQVEVIELDFASAVDVDQAVKGLLSPAGKSWLMETSTEDNRRTREAIVVVDYPANLAQIHDYIARTDQPPRQVLIEAHILQVDLDCDCLSGVNFDALSTSINGNELNWRTVGFANSANPSAFFFEATGGAVESLVELIQNTTDAKTLASPKVLVVSGQQARMQVGEQLGYRVVTTTQTSTLEEVQFLDVGVVLTVAPRITRDGRVLMRIKPEVSTGQVSADTGLPEEETTEVETDILLSSGHGMVIGGLIQEQDSNIQSKIPWLGDLPYVGILFQRRLVEKRRTEIIVTMVPHVLPYSPIIHERESHQLMRSLEPLTRGALDLNYRPYEPRLPDTFRNPRRPVAAIKHLHRLPPVDEGSHGPVAVEMPYHYQHEHSIPETVVVPSDSPSPINLPNPEDY